MKFKVTRTSNPSLTRTVTITSLKGLLDFVKQAPTFDSHPIEPNATVEVIISYNGKEFTLEEYDAHRE